MSIRQTLVLLGLIIGGILPGRAWSVNATDNVNMELTLSLAAVSISCSPNPVQFTVTPASTVSPPTADNPTITCSGTAYDRDNSLDISITVPGGGSTVTMIGPGGASITTNISNGSGLSGFPTGSTAVTSGAFSFDITTTAPDLAGKHTGSYTSSPSHNINVSATAI